MTARSTNYAGDRALNEDLAEALVTVKWAEMFPFTSEAQEGFVLGSSRRYQMLVGGRGIGKTWALANKAFYLSLRNGSLFRDDGTVQFQDGYIWGRQLKEATNNILPYFEDFLRTFKAKTGIPLVAGGSGWSSSNGCLTLANGHRIWMASYGKLSELNKNRGPSASWIAADEVAHAPVSAEAILAVATPSLRPRGPEPDRVERQFFGATSPNGDRGLVGWFAAQHRKKNPEVALYSGSVYDAKHISPEEIEILKLSMDPERWAEEALGLILRPSHVIYPYYREDTHLIGDWFHPDRTHYWGVGIDWGSQRNGYFCFVDIDPFTGKWTIFHEFRAGEMQPGAFRKKLSDDIRYWARAVGWKSPDIFGSDRALTKEHAWVETEYGFSARFGCHTNKSADEQRTATGIKYLSYLLQPLIGSPRLFLAKTLRAGLPPEEYGIRDSLREYRYQMMTGPDGSRVPSADPESNSPASHACDGLRYLVLASAEVPQLHAGRALADVITMDLRG